jgi:hypothetical protein
MQQSWCEQIPQMLCPGTAVCIDNVYDGENGCPARKPTEPDLFSHEGDTRWVGPPGVYPQDMAYYAGSAVIIPAFLAAPMQCEAYFRDWSEAGLRADSSLNLPSAVCSILPVTDCTQHGDDDCKRAQKCTAVDWTTLHVFGAHVLPCSTYEVRVVSECCGDPSDEACQSEPFIVSTAKWGDLWAPRGLGQPNFLDIGKTIEKFKNVPFDAGPPEVGGPPKPWAMSIGNEVDPSKKVGFLDIGRVVEAYKLIAYAETGPVGQCP